MNNCKELDEKIELLINSKNEQFEFLLPNSTYHNFYKFKLALYTEMLSSVQNEGDEANSVQEKLDDSAGQDIDRNRSVKTSSEKHKAPKAKTFPSLKGFFNA